MRTLSINVPINLQALILLTVCAILSSCEKSPPTNTPAQEPDASKHSKAFIAAKSLRPAPFVEAAAERGLLTSQYSGFGGYRYIPEIIAGGAAFIDYDGDGDYDIYMTNAAAIGKTTPPPTLAIDRLFQNDGRGYFVDVTLAAGLGDHGFGLGVAVGDVDGDGKSDLYVTRYGKNLLYHNLGNGSFKEIAEQAGVADPLLSTSATFFDFDRDGDLDLYVCNYVDFDLENYKPCLRSGQEVYCNPDTFNGQNDRLYRNDGQMVFTDISKEAGILHALADRGKGLGVVAGDLDKDGDIDLYVANDGTANHLYINQHAQGEDRFIEDAFFFGAALGENAKPEAGMGTDMGDFDEDGDLDIIVTNLVAQTNSLYRNDGGEGVTESSYSLGLGASTLPFVGFGARFFDFDLDNDLDIFVCNGNVIDNIKKFDSGASHAQEDLLFENKNQRFHKHANPFGKIPPRVGRALATADIDADGDLDLLIINNNQKPTLLLNQVGQNKIAVGIHLTGKQSGTDGYNAKLRAQISGRTIYREINAGGSYLASNDPRVLLGLPAGQNKLDLEIEWPSGIKQQLSLTAGAYHYVVEGQGIVKSTTFQRQ